MSADIHGIPGVKWSIEAALHYAMGRINEHNKALVIWIDDDGRLHYSQCGMNNKDMCWVGTYLVQESMHNTEGILHNGKDPDSFE